MASKACPLVERLRIRCECRADIHLGPLHLAGGRKGACRDMSEEPAQQMHVDLTTDDLAAAERLALEAGAHRLQPTDDVDPASKNGGRVYAGPAGHPFCLRSA